MYKKYQSREKDLHNRFEAIQVLVIDSSTQITDLFKRMLTELGFASVFTANNGFEGVQILRQTRINLVLTEYDLRVPSHDIEHGGQENDKPKIISLSGIDFVKRLRCSPSSPSPYVPIIMFANKVEQHKLMAARDAGVNEISLKPLNAEDLCRRIAYIIEKPRIFITSPEYKGPCRRIHHAPLQGQQPERRKKNLQLIRNHTTKNVG